MKNKQKFLSLTVCDLSLCHMFTSNNTNLSFNDY